MKTFAVKYAVSLLRNGRQDKTYVDYIKAQTHDEAIHNTYLRHINKGGVTVLSSNCLKEHDT